MADAHEGVLNVPADKTGSTPLMLAMHNGHKAAVDLMLRLHRERAKNGLDCLNLSIISKTGWSYATTLGM